MVFGYIDMKRLIAIILSCIALSVNATKVYVSSTGSDATGNGSLSNPYALVSYACTQASAGDTVFILAGTIDQGTTQIVKPVGVSILGEGNASVILTSFTHSSSFQGAIYCASTSGQLTNDNSSISYVRISGNNLAAHRAIYVGYRNNLKIHHCTIENFFVGGIFVNVSATYPTLFASGIEITDNVLNNCATLVRADGTTVENNGALRIRGTTGIIISGNTIDLTFKENGLNGHSMSCTRNKKMKTYNNIFRRLNHEVYSNGNRRWDFFWEEWDYKGDGEFYNNTLYGLGKFSLGGEFNDIESDCSFGYDVYNNQFLNETNNPKYVGSTEIATYAICVEGDGHKKVRVFNNRIQRYEYGIEISTPTSGEGYWHHNWQMRDIEVFNNIIEHIGCIDYTYGTGIWIINETNNEPYFGTFKNIKILNNTVTAANIPGYQSRYGITCNINSYYDSLQIVNNIVSGFRLYPVGIWEHANDSLELNYLRVIYNCLNSTENNTIYLEANERTIVTDSDIVTGNITADPQFASTVTYALSSTSPAIDAGINVGIPYKGLAPDIGAKEFSDYATYYVSQSGLDDASRNGSVGQEWATLSYACSRVTRAGDTIRVTAGNYNETAQCNLSAGVSIRGAGRTTTKITAASSLTRLIYASSTAGTNGNQLISDITFDFNMNALFGVQFFGRSNVIIERTGFENSLRYGLTIADVLGRSENTEPVNWAENNIIRYCHFVNCGRDSFASYTWEADGAIDISGQENMLIYGNDIDNKTGGRYAYGIKGLFYGGFFKGLKIYDNKIRTNIRDVAGEQSFGFNVELWTGVGGNEVYHNDCNGCIDIGGRGWWDSCGYGYAIKVYENVLIRDTRPTNQPEAGLILESGGKDGCYFYRNWVENFTTGFTLGTTANSIVQGYDGVWVTYNIFCNIGYATGGVGAGIGGYNLSSGVTIKNYNVLNNVIHKVNNSSGWGISYEYATANNWENVNLKNNIVFNAYTPIQFRNQTVTSMYIHNNLTYGATRTISHSDSWANSTITLREILNNLENTNPLFNSVGTDFSLQSNSPCINVGTYVGLTRDFYNRKLVGVPDIGAIEYGAIGDINFGKNRQGVMLKSRNWKMMIYN